MDPDYTSYEENRSEHRSGSGLKKVLFVLASVALAGLLTFGIVFLVNEIKGLKQGNVTPSRITANDRETEWVEPVIETAEAIGKGTETVSQTSPRTYVIDVSEIVEHTYPSVVVVTEEAKSFGSRYTTIGSGSGVIIDERNGELLIVTNCHVVSGTSYVSSSSLSFVITFSDGSKADAIVKGKDAESDLAILSVAISDLSEETKKVIRVAPIGDSDQVRIGEGVIVIGNAAGEGLSVTSGIISALNREVTLDGEVFRLNQTDAAINPGNSGGGMFNASGELIGITVAKTVADDIEGMGYVIPITPVRTIIEELMSRETIAPEDRGWLGIKGETISEDFISVYDYPAGVSVSDVIKGSPAEKAGLQVRDIIHAVNGVEIRSMEALRNAVNGYRAGTTVKMTVYRPTSRGYGKVTFEELTIEVTLTRYDDLNVN